MKKLLGSIGIGGALLLLQVSPIFAATHLEDAQVAAQHATCLLGVAATDTTAMAIDLHVSQAQTYLHTAHVHLMEAEDETIDPVWLMKIRYFLRLTEQTYRMGQTVLESPNIHKHFRAWSAYQFAGMLNNEIRAIVDVTHGTCG